ATMTSDAFPAGTSWLTTNFPVDGQARDPQAKGPRIRIREATPGYFQTFGIPILRGRALADADRGAQPAMVLSESAAQILFPGQNPIGHTVNLGLAAGDAWAEMVGVG